jgi:uncharacterized Ntn-hydrolase superfamily protein
MRLLTSVALATLFAVQVQAQKIDPFGGQVPGQETWFGTFSIIAFDPATNQFGVGVQSRAFGAGAAVPWAEAGVGAVATQAAANRTYGPKAMALLKQGLSPQEIIKKITDEDSGRDTRQVAVIDTKGRLACYTGKNVIDRDNNPKDYVHFGDYAGCITVAGKNYSVQGNTLASEEVLKAMAQAFERTEGEMANRLLAALDAGQSKGGDSRGMQSGGILVVQAIPNGDTNRTTDRIVDIRVDDSENPFKELHRILNVQQSGPHNTKATQLANAGKMPEAIAELKIALEMNPKNEQINYNLAVDYAKTADYKSSLAALSTAIQKQPRLKMNAADEPAFDKMKDMAEFKRLIQK